MNIINIEHISKVYGEKVIFDDASYGIQEGDKIGIIGINGTGKTTLLNMIAGREETDTPIHPATMFTIWSSRRHAHLLSPAICFRMPTAS